MATETNAGSAPDPALSPPSQMGPYNDARRVADEAVAFPFLTDGAGVGGGNLVRSTRFSSPGVVTRDPSGWGIGRRSGLTSDTGSKARSRVLRVLHGNPLGVPRPVAARLVDPGQRPHRVPCPRRPRQAPCASPPLRRKATHPRSVESLPPGRLAQPQAVRGYLLTGAIP